MSRYEAKLGLMLKCMPLMNKTLASQFMKTIERVLNEPANNSIFKMNVNPLRMGLILYRVLEEVQTMYAYSDHSTTIMQQSIVASLTACLEMYNDPNELMILVE